MKDGKLVVANRLSGDVSLAGSDGSVSGVLSEGGLGSSVLSSVEAMEPEKSLVTYYASLR